MEDDHKENPGFVEKEANYPRRVVHLGGPKRVRHLNNVEKIINQLKNLREKITDQFLQYVEF